MNRTSFTSALAMAALAAILLPSFLQAQITFQRTYGGSASDGGNSALQTADGGFLVIGGTRSYGAGGSDIYLVRTDSIGDTIWTRTLGGTGYEEGFSVRQTADGGFIVAGVTSSYGAGSGDVYLIRTDSDCDTLWTRVFGGPASDWGHSAEPTADGGCIVTGLTESFGSGSADIYVVRTNCSGDTLWTRTFGGVACDEGWSAQQAFDSGFIIAGHADTSGSGFGDNDMYLIKTDARGDTTWTRSFGNGTGSWDDGLDAQQTIDSGYIVAGRTQSQGLDTLDFYLVRTNRQGEKVWTRTYGGPDWDEAFSVQQTADGGFIAVGYTRSFGSGQDVYLVKTDASGDTLWTRIFGVDGATGHSVRQTTDGGYVIAGFVASSIPDDYDMLLIKTDSLGNVAASVAEPKASLPRASALSLSCEPNPFRARTAISLQLTAGSPAQLTVFDASGRCVRTLAVNLTSCATWDGTDELGQPLSSGTYFIRCDVAGEHASTRVVLQR